MFDELEESALEDMILISSKYVYWDGKDRIPDRGCRMCSIERYASFLWLSSERTIDWLSEC